MGMDLKLNQVRYTWMIRRERRGASSETERADDYADACELSRGGETIRVGCLGSQASFDECPFLISGDDDFGSRDGLAGAVEKDVAEAMGRWVEDHSMENVKPKERPTLIRRCRSPVTGLVKLKVQSDGGF